MLDMPCLRKPGLRVFTPTSDQRLMLGENVFLETHFPMRMKRFRKRHHDGELGEQELLAMLDDAENAKPGNRVFILYGAAGSGKSELMSWLNLKLHQQDSTRPIARISRTELNALMVTEKLRFWLTGEYFSDATHERWAQARRKPRTLAKLLVLHALESLLDTDEVIAALYYRLVDFIEPYVLRLVANSAPLPADEPIEMFKREEFESLRGYLERMGIIK